VPENCKDEVDIHLNLHYFIEHVPGTKHYAETVQNEFSRCKHTLVEDMSNIIKFIFLKEIFIKNCSVKHLCLMPIIV
jgi:hypothetical protein